VNRSGDQLALDDFMDKESLDDLLEYVLDEYTTPQPAQKPLMDAKIVEIARKHACGGLEFDSCESLLAFFHEAKLKEKNHG
jgi:hypothetical protein